jgi:hypothetical protein
LVVGFTVTTQPALNTGGARACVQEKSDQRDQ